MENGKPDRLDTQIIRHLREDGRRPTKTIAGAIGVSEATVTARIRALNDANVMRVMAQQNVAVLSEPLPVFINVWVRGRSIDEVARDLAQEDRIATIHLCVGSPEIQVTAFVAEQVSALAALQQRIGRVPGIDRLEMTVALEMRTYRSDYAALDVVPPGGAGMADPLDDKIWRQLRADGRISNREIARLLDVPASTVRERVNRMLGTDTIRIGAVCDASRFGLASIGFGHLRVRPDALAAALDHLQGIDDIGICALVSGRYNIYALFAARGFEHLAEIVKTRLETTPGLQEIAVRLAAGTPKHRADLISIVPRACTG